MLRGKELYFVEVCEGIKYCCQFHNLFLMSSYLSFCKILYSTEIR